MKKVTIKALSGKTNSKNPASLHGITCGDEFIEYCDDAYAEKIVEGFMSFSFEDGKLYILTEYFLKEGENLSSSELKELSCYTQGQWSDGIGEGFEQWPVCEQNGEEIFISPWYTGQKVSILTE